jgi:hypothetical protein
MSFPGWPPGWSRATSVRRPLSNTDPFTDLLFNILLGFTFLFFIAIVFMNPITKLGNVILKAEYIITVTWPDDQPDDVDVWVEDPHGQVVSYLKSDSGWMHLDRDDRGDINDTVVIEGREVVYPINQEVVTLRGIIAGEYTVNLHYYDSVTERPVEVTVKIERVNPTLKLVFVDQVTLENRDDERTVVRFTLNTEGDVIAMNRNPKTLTRFGFESS